MIVNRYHRTALYCLAERTSRASRAAGSPINYYAARADIELLLAGGHDLDEAAAILRAHYGHEAWDAMPSRAA